MRDLKSTFIKYCIGKGIDATGERIDITIKYLKGNNCTDEEIRSALNKLYGDSPFFPDASMILKILKPSAENVSDTAQEIVGEIMAALPNYSAGVSEKLSDNAELIVARFGGWGELLSFNYSQLTNVRAQLREMAKAIIRKNVGTENNMLPRPTTKLIK